MEVNFIFRSCHALELRRARVRAKQLGHAAERPRRDGSRRKWLRYLQDDGDRDRFRQA